MPQFRVTLVNIRVSGATSQSSLSGKHGEFQIQRLTDRRTFHYEGNGDGKQFNFRCELLIAAGGVVVDAEDDVDGTPSLEWRKAIVTKAMEKAEEIQ